MISFFPSTIMQSGGGLDPDYQAVIDFAILQGYSLPTSAIQQRDSQRVANLKTELVWDELDVFYIMDQSFGCSDFARINFKSPASFYLQEAPTYSLPTFVPENGFKGGSGLGFNTGWNASLNAVKFINNNNSFIIQGFDYLTGGGGTQIYIWARTGNNTSQIAIYYSNNQYIQRSATTAGSLGGASTFNSHLLLNRFSNTREVYENGSLVTSNSGINGPGVFSNLNLYLLCANENGTTAGQNNYGINYIGWGSDLSAKSTKIYQIMEGIY